MLRLAAFAVTSVLATAAAGPLPPLAPLPLDRLLSSPDRLTISVSHTGNPRADGEYLLECHPVAGDHPRAEQACARLDGFARAGENPFAEEPRRQMCTQQDGGPARAHITGTWQGRKVNASFRRTNGCEIARWRNLEPVLPAGRS
ncbi:SSI family serine proteinase inhibitor [Streptomyces sp. NPDC090445]|uniref:SSI family serine proteinase inhibitor n=1 Tax=Streptomyces sp. NPDC090445 TaxID=3365963 RepID=UPI003823FE82